MGLHGQLGDNFTLFFADVFWDIMYIQLKVNRDVKGTVELYLPWAFTLVSFVAYSTLKMEAMFLQNVS
jgi:hypothetical protein